MILSKISQRQITKLSLRFQQRQFSQILKAFATVDPENLGEHAKGFNLVNGKWESTEKTRTIIDPMNGKPMVAFVYR